MTVSPPGKRRAAPTAAITQVDSKFGGGGRVEAPHTSAAPVAAFVREPGCVCTDPSFVARAGHERRCPLYGKPTPEDKLAVMAHRMTDEELRATIEAIIGNPKRAGSQACRLNMGESLALAALMAEEANRVRA